MNIQLCELIVDEMERINPVLEKLGRGAKVIAKLTQEGHDIFERKKEETEHPEDIPERDLTITYLTTLMRKCLDMAANGYVLAALGELHPLNDACEADPEDNKLDSLCESHRVGLESFHNKLEKIDKPSYLGFLVFHYFIDGGLNKIADKLSGYGDKVKEISEDEDFKDVFFLKSITSAYAKITLEFENISLPSIDAKDPAEFHVKMDKPVLEGYYNQLLSIRTQELFLDSLSRIYDNYKESDEE